MVQDYPDYTLTTDIIAQTIGNIAVDITAQTLATLDVDITAQTLAQLNVNIAASAITLNVDIAAQSVENLSIDIAAQTLSQLDINIAASAVTLTVTVSGTCSISIDAATINIGALRLLDVGTLKRVDGGVTDGIITLYTVPTGKVFYVYHYDFNNSRAEPGLVTSRLFFYDGATEYTIARCKYPDGVDHFHTQGSFTMMKILEDWSIRLKADVDGSAYATTLGCETDA